MPLSVYSRRLRVTTLPSNQPASQNTNFYPTGVKELDVSLETQTVKVTAGPELSYATVEEKIKKTGKEILSGKQID